MDSETFRKHAHALVEWMATYYEGLEDRRVNADVKPGYLSPKLPKRAPEFGETWEHVMMDVEQHVLPGITHWQSPNFYGYFPANSSYPGILGEMLSATFNTIGFSWAASPVQTELEGVVMDWLAQAMDLPKCFHGSSQGGGGVIQGTASEAILVAMLAARARASNRWRSASVGRENGVDIEGNIAEEGPEDQFPSHRLVVYSSDQAHSAVQKACMVSGVEHFRRISTCKDYAYAMQASDLEEKIQEDLSKGLIPFFVCATVGTTSSCAVDPLESLGEVLQKYGLYGHVDAAYAGTAMLCPEFRVHFSGLNKWHSLASNCHKWMLTNFDCTAMWTRDSKSILDALSLTPEYLRNEASDSGLVRDYKDWQVPLGRRFRSLKLWFVMRTYGIRGLQAHVRGHIALAKKLEEYILNDTRFELVAERKFALVCFRLCGGDTEQSNAANRSLLEALNASGKIFLTHTILDGMWVLRMAIGGTRTQEKHVQTSWELISKLAGEVLAHRV